MKNNNMQIITLDNKKVDLGVVTTIGKTNILNIHGYNFRIVSKQEFDRNTIPNVQRNCNKFI